MSIQIKRPYKLWLRRVVARYGQRPYLCRTSYDQAQSTAPALRVARCLGSSACLAACHGARVRGAGRKPSVSKRVVGSLPQLGQMRFRAPVPRCYAAGPGVRGFRRGSRDCNSGACGSATSGGAACGWRDAAAAGAEGQRGGWCCGCEPGAAWKRCARRLRWPRARRLGCHLTHRLPTLVPTAHRADALLRPRHDVVVLCVPVVRCASCARLFVRARVLAEPLRLVLQTADTAGRTRTISTASSCPTPGRQTPSARWTKPPTAPTHALLTPKTKKARVASPVLHCYSAFAGG